MPADDAELLYHEGGNVLLRLDDLMVQIRAGALTDATLDAIVGAAEPLIARLDRAGFVSVIEPSAELPPAPTRDRQKRVIASLIRDLEVRVAVVIPGEGVQPSLSRTVARMLLVGNRSVKIASDVGSAIAWVESHVSERARAELRDVIARGRALAAAP